MYGHLPNLITIGQYWPYEIGQSQSTYWSYTVGQYWFYEGGQSEVLILQCWPPIIYGHVSCYFDTGQYWSYGSGRLISRDHGPGTWILASTCSTCLASHNLWTSPILLRYWPVLGLRGWPVTLPPPSYSLLIITNGPTGWPVHCLHEFSTVGQPPAAHIVWSFGTSRLLFGTLCVQRLVNVSHERTVKLRMQLDASMSYLELNALQHKCTPPIYSLLIRAFWDKKTAPPAAYCPKKDLNFAVSDDRMLCILK
ncbi:hypothetical protein EDD22DRAFT_850776 [Suillus occidentalis]|nr:hypothetical protein EDD22DRAFT_850776 [Suillus occidentalis]